MRRYAEIWGRYAEIWGVLVRAHVAHDVAPLLLVDEALREVRIRVRARVRIRVRVRVRVRVSEP